MVDRVIRIVIDPTSAEKGLSKIEGELQAVDAAAARQKQTLRDLADTAQLTGDTVVGTTADLAAGFKLAETSTQAFGVANEQTVKKLGETVVGFEKVSTAAKSIGASSGEFDDLRARLDALKVRADAFGGSLGDAANDGEEAVGGLGRAFGALRTAAFVLTGIAAAVAAVGLAAVLTQKETRTAFVGLGRDILDVGRAALAGLREVLGPVSEVIDGLIEKSRGVVQGLRDSILDLAGVTDFVTTEQKRYNEAFTEAKDVGEGFASQNIGSLNELANSLITTRDELGQTTAELIRFRAEAAIDQGANDLTVDFAQAIADVNKELAAGNIEQVEANAQLAALNSLQQAATADYDTLSESVRRYADELATATERQERLDQALSTLEGLQTAEDKFTALQEDLRFLFDEGIISAQRFAEELGKAVGQIDLEGPRESITELERIARHGARNLQGIFADNLFNGFEDGLDGMVLQFALALQKMAAEALASQIFGAIFGTTTTGFGGGGGLGDVFGGLFGGRAFGGSTKAGQPVMVGERGPEIFVPPTAGSIVPNGQMGGFAAPAPEVNVTNVNVFDSGEIPAAMQTAAGNKVLFNFVSTHRGAINQMLGAGR